MAKSKKLSVFPIVDVEIFDEGSIVQFMCFSNTALDWVNDNVQLEGWQWIGGRSFAVDHRFAGNLADGMQAEGLVFG